VGHDESPQILRPCPSLLCRQVRLPVSAYLPPPLSGVVSKALLILSIPRQVRESNR